MVVFSPAKINIHLDIKESRPDGFHNIISLFHKVDLYDEIEICSLKNADNCSIEGDFDCKPCNNLIIKAADVFLARTGIKKAFHFKVKKQIPMGAGLGGGSGNAAMVLKSLNEICGNPMSSLELYELAGILGSDVPFFLGGASALVTGRGEILKELFPLKGYEIILVVPELCINTAYAYELFDREGRVCNKIDEEGVERAYYSGNCIEWPFFNSFWEPMRGNYPVLSTISRVFQEEGSDFYSLSGSGSSFFGFFSCSKASMTCYNRLKAEFKRVWKIKLLA